MTTRYDERTSDGERQWSDYERAAIRLDGHLSQATRLGIEGDVARSDQSTQDHADFRPTAQISLFGPTYMLSGRYDWFEDLNQPVGTLIAQNWYSTLSLWPKGYPEILLGVSGSSFRDDLSPHAVDSEFMNWRVEASHRIDHFRVRGYHSETRTENATAGIATLALASGATHIAADASGFLFVADSAVNQVVKFTSSGSVAAIWGGTGVGFGQFNGVRGIAVDSVGNVYIVDSGNQRVQRFDGVGTYLGQWGAPGAGPGQFNTPTGIAIDATGVYVVDSGNGRIQKFDATGTYILEWGTPGGGLGQFSSPEGIAAGAGFVFVADRGNNRIQRFDPTGGGATAWGTAGSGPGQFLAPSGVAVDAAGVVYVSDTLNHRGERFTSAGVFLGQWGSLGTANGQFNQPFGVAVDPVPFVHVVDSLNARVEVFTTAGAFIRAYGQGGAPTGRQVVTSRQDFAGVEFDQILWDVLHVSGGYGAYWFQSEDRVNPLVDVRSFRDVAHAELQFSPLDGITLSYGWTREMTTTDAASTDSERTTEGHRASLSATPHEGITGTASFDRTSLRQTGSPEVRTHSLSTSLDLVPIPRILASVGFVRAQTFQAGDEVSRQWGVSFTSTWNVREGIDLRWTLAQSHSDDLVGGSETLSRSALVDLYLRPWERLTGYVHGDLTSADSEAAGGDQTSRSAGLFGAAGWQMSDLNSLSLTGSYGRQEADPGGSSERWTLGSQFYWRWASHSVALTYQVTDDGGTLQTAGQQGSFQLAPRMFLRDVVQYVVAGPGAGDWFLGVEFAMTF